MRTLAALGLTVGLTVGLSLGLAAAATPADAADFKMGTLAPKGSSWAKILEKGSKEIETKTAGRVKLKYYMGGQLGDEKDMVRQMKLGSVDGGAVTAVGLSLIKGDVRVLEMPLLFKNDKELDHVRGQLAPEFEKQFLDAGYVLLAWGDIGWTNLMTGIEVKSKADLKNVKMWAWTDDIIVRTLFKRIGVNGVPLGVPDVLPALQTGTINGCYGSPLVAIALQWYTKVKFASSTPLNYSIGALIMSKAGWAKISPEDQAAMRVIFTALGQDLQKTIRKDNERAKKAMEKAGVKFVPIPADLMADITKEAAGTVTELTGKLFQKELLDKVQKSLAQVRK